MSIVRDTNTGQNYLEKITTEGDIIARTTINSYQKQVGSDGASSNTVFTLDSSYRTGTYTLQVFINGQKAEYNATPTNATQYNETNSLTITFGASLQDSDIVEFMVIGSYNITMAFQNIYKLSDYDSLNDAVTAIA